MQRYPYFCSVKQTAVRTFLLLMISALLIISCRKEDDFDDNPSLRLGFSTDTLAFDTVFTSVGSATRWLKVFNPSKHPINISSVRLEGGRESRFRMNVDGEAMSEISNVELAGGDSLFIFVRVTVDPNQQNTPMVVEDRIEFQLNGQWQQVQLVAWGQDAYFYRRAILQGDLTWTNDKPHVIYDWIIVDSSYSLTIQQGTRVHLHAHAVLAVNTDATLRVQGSVDEPVHFLGDRLEQAYQDVPGQWGRIWLSPGSINNVIDHALIENGQVGLQVDTLGNSSQPTLKITNSVIRNMSIAGMLLQGSWVEVNNCLIGDCGEFSVVLNIGGKYDFRHCTIGNYYSDGIRQTPTVALNNYYLYQGDTIARPLEQAYFGNCIIWGRNSEELVYDRTPRAAFEYQFDHCLIRTEKSLSDPLRYISCIRNADPLFNDPYEQDLSLKENSPAINAGNLQIALGIPADLLGNSRVPDPDLGALEYQAE